METAHLERITKEAAITMQWSLIRQWEKRLDTWPFTYGIGTLAALCAGSGAIFNHSFRKALKLGSEFRKASYMPIVGIPTLFCGLFHGYFVASDILIQDTRCFACLESRAIGIQLAFGAAYPLVLAPLTAFMGARRFYTYNTPNAWEGRKILKLWWSMTKSFQTKINIIAVVHIAAAALITHQESLAIAKINSKLDEMLENKSKTNSVEK